MKSALKIVAFGEGDANAAIVALLETALEALDQEGLKLAAVHVDWALAILASGLDVSLKEELEAFPNLPADMQMN